MAGALQFTLGLNVSEFLHNCGLSSGAIIGLEKIGEGLHHVFDRVWQTIEQAGALEHLSRRTGESAGNLYRLQAAFAACGVGGDGLATMIYHMQKSLGGTNEMGESTIDIFQRLGLNLTKLKTAGASAPFIQIIRSLAGLNQDSATKAASSVFGRMGAGAAVQLSRSIKEFLETMKAAGPQADVMMRIAAAAAHVHQSLQRIKSQFTGLFAGIAQGALPPIESILDSLKSIDLTGIGLSAGKVLAATVQAFKEGTLTELIGESLKTGFEIGFAVLPGLFEKMGFLLLKTFETPLNYLQAGMTFAINQMFNNPKLSLLLKFTSPGLAVLGQLAGLTGGKPQTFADILADQKEHGLAFNLGTGEFGLGDINADANRRLADFRANMARIVAPLLDLINGLSARAPKLARSAADAAGIKSLDLSKGAYKIEGNVFEKMGFVSGSGGPAQDTARNTARAAELLEQINERLGPAGSSSSPLAGDILTHQLR